MRDAALASDEPRAYLERAARVTMDTKLVSSIDAVAGSRLVTIGADALLVDAAKLLSDTHISLVVCDADGAMVGVITKTDIVQKLGRCEESACTIAVADVMSRDVTYCRPTDDLSSVLSMMAKRGFAHVPVIDEHSKPLGVIYARDALRALLADKKYEASLLRDYIMGIGYR